MITVSLLFLDNNTFIINVADQNMYDNSNCDNMQLSNESREIDVLLDNNEIEMRDLCKECSFTHSTCICDTLCDNYVGKTTNVNSTYTVNNLELFTSDENIGSFNILNMNIADTEGDAEGNTEGDIDHNINGKQNICLKY